jgi:hypothetical protein
VTISVSKLIRHRPCSSTYCNRHATQFSEFLTQLFSAASPQFALHFPFDSLQIASPAPCAQYMTRTNAENHFATFPSDSVSKWYGPSQRLPGCLISAFAARPTIAHRPFNRLLGILHQLSGHFRQNSRSRALISRRSALKKQLIPFRAQSTTRTAAELTL